MDDISDIADPINLRKFNVSKYDSLNSFSIKKFEDTKTIENQMVKMEEYIRDHDNSLGNIFHKKNIRKVISTLIHNLYIVLLVLGYMVWVPYIYTIGVKHYGLTNTLISGLHLGIVFLLISWLAELLDNGYYIKQTEILENILKRKNHDKYIKLDNDEWKYVGIEPSWNIANYLKGGLYVTFRPLGGIGSILIIIFLPSLINLIWLEYGAGGFQEDYNNFLEFSNNYNSFWSGYGLILIVVIAIFLILQIIKSIANIYTNYRFKQYIINNIDGKLEKIQVLNLEVSTTESLRTKLLILQNELHENKSMIMQKGIIPDKNWPLFKKIIGIYIGILSLISLIISYPF